MPRLSPQLPSFFRRLATLIHNPEKMLYEMSTPDPPIRAVFESSTIQLPTKVWLQKLVAAELTADLTRRADLENCRIFRVEHRRNSTYPHEIVLVWVRHQPSQFQRVVRLERYKHLHDHSGQQGLRAVSHVFKDYSADLIGLQTGNRDMILIGDSLQNVKASSYDVVESFDITADDQPNVLHCAAAAVTLSDYAKDYSGVAYMCLWWARSLFLLLKGRVEMESEHVLAAERGPSFPEAGCFSSLRLINEDASIRFSTGFSATDSKKLTIALMDATVNVEDVAAAQQQIAAEIARIQDPENQVFSGGRTVMVLQGLYSSCLHSSLTTLDGRVEAIAEQVHRVSHLETRILEVEQQANDADQRADKASQHAKEAEERADEADQRAYQAEVTVRQLQAMMPDA
ncbi:hypothetical protein FISHEDRAFT_74464 [Fistulina hepatica ATCC 64428]|uniref:Uncharacterized protein n=1 Tax=Fistulina hepatica ATCC 64428 TaxID=1128425 RepID=A0A0D7A9H2_9AGAR|nr:hypothetical protein FISHEDRAFT_74464 [Fistulina hepatica ATCC 64428]